MMRRNTAIRIDTPDGPKLGFATGIIPRRFRSADTVAIKKSEGIIVHPDGRSSGWRMEQLVEIDGEMAAVGPWIPDTKEIRDKDVDPGFLRLLLIAARTLGASGFPLGGYDRRAIRRLGDGGILVFPPVLAAWTRESESAEILAAEWEPWCHPELVKEAAWSFAFGVLVWKALTGKDPYKGETGENRRERIRLGLVNTSSLDAAGVVEDAAAVIRRALNPDAGTCPDFTEWRKLIETWSKGEIRRDLTPAEELKLREIEDRQDGKLEGRLRSRRWLRNSGWKVLSIGAAAVIVAIFVSAPIRKALETPLTAGMDSYQVAETFYSGLTSLDSEILDDCLARGIGKDDQRQVDMIYVTERVRRGYENVQSFPNAEEWLAAGRPDLDPGAWPWGVVDLEMRILSDGRIEAQYRFFYPKDGVDPQSEKYIGESRRDVLSFEEGRRSWRISGIDRTIVD